MILFFDVDGTLWDYKNYIPESTKKAIKLAQENGHKCFINTGRARAFVYNKELLGIGFDGIVSACGCMIEYEDKILFNKLMTRDEGIRTMESVRKHGFKPILEGPTYLYMDKPDFADDMFGQKVIREMGERLLGITDKWGEWEMNKLSCICDSPTRDECFEELSDIYDFMLHSDTIVEMVPKGFNKGTGIKEVCELLGCDVSETVAFGDSINDKEMLEVAGTSVVMGRAPEEVKNLGTIVTENLEDDGIWRACEKLNLF